MRTSRIAIGYSLINYNDVIELMGNSAITAAGYSFQKISKCLNGKKLSTGGRIWVLNQLTFKDWEQKVSAAVVNKKFELKVTESEVIERIKDTKIRLVPGTYQGTRKKAFLTVLVMLIIVGVLHLIMFFAVKVVQLVQIVNHFQLKKYTK